MNLIENSSIIKIIGVNRKYNVQKRYGFFKKEKLVTDALIDINLEIKRGEIFGLVGINGAGKTTLIKILATLLYPTSGIVEIDGLDVIGDSKRIRHRINMAAGAERMLHYRLSARENLHYYANLYNVPPEKIDSKVNKLLELVDMVSAADVPVERYSKGMKQRIQIARSLINDPQILLLDEPTLGLDIHIAKQIRGIIQDRVNQERMTVLLTSHYLYEIEELVDRLAIIHEGKILAIGTPDQIKEQFNLRKITEIKIQTNNISSIRNQIRSEPRANISKIEQIENISINEYSIKMRANPNFDMEAFLQKLLVNARLKSLSTITPTLEEAFLKILEKEID